MFETVFTAEPRAKRNPLHPNVTDAVAYGLANTQPGDDFEVWQVADDIDRTRVCCVQTVRVPDSLEQHRIALRALETELGVELRLGYIGNVSPGRDDRSWDVVIHSHGVPKHQTEGRGPWSHRASGTSYPATRSWRTADFPTVDQLVTMVRERLAREVAARP